MNLLMCDCFIKVQNSNFIWFNLRSCSKFVAESFQASAECCIWRRFPGVYSLYRWLVGNFHPSPSQALESCCDAGSSPWGSLPALQSSPFQVEPRSYDSVSPPDSATFANVLVPISLSPHPQLSAIELESLKCCQCCSLFLQPLIFSIHLLLHPHLINPHGLPTSLGQSSSRVVPALHQRALPSL